MVAPYLEKLKTLTEEGDLYTSLIVFNVHETGLFWKKMPKKLFIAREENVSKLQHRQRSIASHECADAISDCQLKSHLENPRALKNKSKTGLPVI